MEILEKCLFIFLLGIYTSCAKYDPEPPDTGSFGDDEIHIIEIESVDNVYSRQATLHIKVKNEIHLDKLLLCYSTENPLPEKTDAVKDLLSEYKSGSFTHELKRLKPATDYYCRIYMEIDGKAGYSECIHFMTKELTRAGAWEHISDFPTEIEGTRTSFVLDDVFYFHNNNMDYNNTGGIDIWTYALTTKKWERVITFPGGERKDPLSFVINGKAYMGFGYTYLEFYKQNLKKDLWEYNPATNEWTQMRDMPVFDNFKIISLFSLQGKGYVVAYGTSSPYAENSPYVFQFDPQANEWIKRNFFRGEKMDEVLTITTPTRSYLIGGVYQDKNQEKVSNETWEYNSRDDIWTRVADFTGGRRTELWGFAIGERVFAGYGRMIYADNKVNYINDFWEYIPEENVWEQCSESNAWDSVISTFSFGYKEFGYIGSIYKGIYRYNPNRDR